MSLLCFVVTLVFLLRMNVGWRAKGRHDLIKRVEGRRAGRGLLLKRLTHGLLKRLTHGLLLRGGLAGGHLGVRQGGHLERGLVVHSRMAAAGFFDVE